MTETVRGYHLALLLSLAVLVWGDYEVNVYVYSYNNPTSHCQDCVVQDRVAKGCCDTFDPDLCSGSQKCDNYFMFCWRALNTAIESRTNTCRSSILATTTIVEDVDNFNFGRDVLGLSNPLMYSAGGPWMGQQFYVEVKDFDDTSVDELVDSFSIPITTQRINRTMYTGYYGFSSIELSFDANCAKHFYGTDCTTECNDDRDGSTYDCDSEGNRVCNSGYIGTNCDINTDECSRVNCSRNGQCLEEAGTSNIICDCYTGITGSNCETNIDDCQAEDCSGNGKCEDQVNSFMCVCNPGYTGEVCEISIDDCQAENCSGNGQCEDQVNSFMCVCNPGYTGEVCEINIDDCQAENCSGNGQCEDQVNSFMCVCDPGYTGEVCEINIDDCQAENCSGNGECEDGVNSFMCVCDPGYTGEVCEIDIDDCQAENCSGNGECLDGVNSFTCMCKSGYSGVNCDFLLSQDTTVTMPENTVHNMTASNSNSPQIKATPLLVGGIIGELLGALLIAVLIVVCGIAIARKLRRREMKLIAKHESDLNSFTEQTEDTCTEI